MLLRIIIAYSDCLYCHFFIYIDLPLSTFVKRPWYISGAVQRSKDVVALIDVSSNVDKTLFKESMQTFLRTLDPRDKVCSMV